MPINPCHQCENRDIKCHATCTVYLEWFSARQKLLKEIHKQQSLEYDLLRARFPRHGKPVRDAKHKMATCPKFK